ncbi:MAG TPA: glycosyltransferase, partial [Solirubrobacteraceae bacterium]|nr:glycosyltransferase [Solirubrobacteraceae bacterium]
MRFVLANRLLDQAGGTEVHLLTLAEQLQRLGHEVCVYSPELGPFTDHVRRRGVDVVGELRALPGDCDAVLSQDALVVYELAERYPAAFHAFRVCGDVLDFQLPPQLDGILDMVVVLSDRYERLVRACAVKAPVVRLRIPIDADRLTPIAPIRRRPERTVLLGNYRDRDELVEEAGRHGIEVTRIGAREQRYDLEAALAGVDIVVAKGRAALDAMGCGRAVYVFDVFGGDGWVTPAAYAALEADNFAGQATDRVIGVAELERDLAGYDHRMGIANRDLVAQHHGALDHAIAFVNAIGVREPGARSDAPLRELGRLT